MAVAGLLSIAAGVGVGFWIEREPAQPAATGLDKPATTVAPPTTAAPKVPTVEEAFEDLKDALTMQKVFFAERLVFTGDVAWLNEVDTDQDWAEGLAAGAPGSISLVVTDRDRLACMTTITDEGPAVMTAFSPAPETVTEVRFGPGPLPRCDLAAAATLQDVVPKD